MSIDINLYKITKWLTTIILFSIGITFIIINVIHNLGDATDGYMFISGTIMLVSSIFLNVFWPNKKEKSK